jgi:hypothetical protein
MNKLSRASGKRRSPSCWRTKDGQSDGMQLRVAPVPAAWQSGGCDESVDFLGAWPAYGAAAKRFGLRAGFARFASHFLRELWLSADG